MVLQWLLIAKSNPSSSSRLSRLHILAPSSLPVSLPFLYSASFFFLKCTAGELESETGSHAVPSAWKNRLLDFYLTSFPLSHPQERGFSHHHILLQWSLCLLLFFGAFIPTGVILDMFHVCHFSFQAPGEVAETSFALLTAVSPGPLLVPGTCRSSVSVE